MKYLQANNETLINISDGNNTDSNSQCDLFGSFGFYVQIVLALKRFVEKPKRPWKIWFFDVSKQIITASMAHFINIFLALLLSIGNKTDQCVWYFLNILMDTTLGLFLTFILMLMVDKMARCKNMKNIQSGLYFETEIMNGKKKTKLKVKMYFIQLGVWVLVVLISKSILLIFQKLYTDFLENLGNKAMSPFTNGKLKLLIVMVVIPFICNAFQFWVVDNILKFNPSNSQELELLKDGEVSLNKKNGEKVIEYKLPDDNNDHDVVEINFEKA